MEKLIRCTFDGSFEFNKIHGFYGLQLSNPSVFYEDKGKMNDGTKFWLFIDTPEQISPRKSEVLKAKEDGIKIISLFYDEARFPLVDQLISDKLIDKIILFDKKYENRFSIDTLISDYYLSDMKFPDFNEERNGEMCYFGHKKYERYLPKDCVHISKNSLQGLYKEASLYTKGCVFSTGKGENGDLIYHNKAKFLEMIFCGLEVEYQEGINTINYEEYKNKKILKSDLNDLSEINNKVKSDIYNFICR